MTTCYLDEAGYKVQGKKRTSWTLCLSEAETRTTISAIEAGLSPPSFRENVKAGIRSVGLFTGLYEIGRLSARADHGLGGLAADRAPPHLPAKTCS